MSCWSLDYSQLGIAEMYMVGCMVTSIYGRIWRKISQIEGVEFGVDCIFLVDRGHKSLLIDLLSNFQFWLISFGIPFRVHVNNIINSLNSNLKSIYKK